MPQAPVRRSVEIPEMLLPFTTHGMEFEIKQKNATAECPWCGRDNKFAVDVKTGMWQCWGCREGTKKGGGNARIFLRMLYERSLANLTLSACKPLAENRSLLFASTVQSWGICQNYLNNEWLVPGWGVKGQLNSLYRYVSNGKRSFLQPTPGMGHQLGGMSLYDPDKSTIYVCEGVWDALALWEVLNRCDGDYNRCAPKDSILKDACVLYTPSAGSFFDTWVNLFAGKHVVFMTQNDHARTHEKTGQKIAPASYSQMVRVREMLYKSNNKPKSFGYLCWGEEGYTEELPSGYDVRDALSGVKTGNLRPLAERITALQQLSTLVRPYEQQSHSEQARGFTNGMGCLPCQSYKQLTTAWRKAVKWTDGMNRALSVMLASVTSTMSVGDQLWVKILGPASCGKSTLCEALTVNSQYVFAKSSIRGFHSGYRSDDGEDNSLITLIRNKTLVTKDGDTLLKSPNVGQILSEARDLYDSTTRSHYRNQAGRDYSGVRMTWILCGTSSLKCLDQSELGERFLDCIMMQGIDEDLEDEILWRVANRASRNMGTEVTETEASTHYEPELATAMQLTGGYIDFLRENAADLLSAVEFPEKSLYQCTRLGKFVAYMRARPSKLQGEMVEREFAARLTSQITRAAKCLAVVLNCSVIDETVMKHVKQLAFDTANGPTLRIIELIDRSADGLEKKTISQKLCQTENYINGLLRFLKEIEAVQVNEVEQSHTRAKTKRNLNILTPRMQRLYREVKDL